MTPNCNILLIITLSLAASYGWGMRGTTIGGEKGAMLPGALVGLFTAMFCGVPLFYENYFVLSALGAVGMYFGGCMTYGETLAFSMSTRPAENMKKGLLALFLKGFLWFGVFGAIFSLGITFYFFGIEKCAFAIICVALPAGALSGYFVFNKAHGKNLKPKIYFSKTRQENWGAMLGIFAAFTAYSVFSKNTFSLLYSLICAAFGGFGWVLGQLFQIFSLHYAKNTRFLRFLRVGKSVSPWKIMECTFGFFGGLGAAVAILASRHLIAGDIAHKNADVASKSTVHSAFVGVWLGLLAIDMIHYIFINKKNNGKKVNAYLALCEYCEPIIYAAFPMMMIFWGNETAARLSSFFLVFWVVVQEVFFEKLYKTKRSLITKLAFTALGIAFVVLEIAKTQIITPFFTLIMYGAFYEGVTLLWIFEKLIKRNKTEGVPVFKQFTQSEYITVHTYFCAVIAVITAIAAAC